MNRKIITCLAVGANIYIARPGGEVDWLDGPRPKGEYALTPLPIPFVGHRALPVEVRVGGAKSMSANLWVSAPPEK